MLVVVKQLISSTWWVFQYLLNNSGNAHQTLLPLRGAKAEGVVGGSVLGMPQGVLLSYTSSS